MIYKNDFDRSNMEIMWMSKQDYINEINQYLTRCYKTVIYKNEDVLLNLNYKDQLGIGECAEAIYTLRLLRNNLRVTRNYQRKIDSLNKKDK